MQKNPQTRVDILWIFKDFHRFLRVQSPSCTPAREFQQWHLAANCEIIYRISEKFPTPVMPPSPLLPQLLGTLQYLNILNNIIDYILHIGNVIIKTQKCSYFSCFTFDISRNQRPDKCQHVVWKVMLGYFSIIVTDLLFMNKMIILQHD